MANTNLSMESFKTLILAAGLLGIGSFLTLLAALWIVKLAYANLSSSNDILWLLPGTIFLAAAAVVLIRKVDHAKAQLHHLP